MREHEKRVTYVSFVLAFLYLLGKLTLANAQDNCLPEVGESGSLTSVALIIQTWETRSSNFHVSYIILVCAARDWVSLTFMK